MRLENIRREKGHAVRLSFEGGGNVLLDLDLCAEKCIREGDEFSEAQIKELLSESEYRRAKSRALWLLDRYRYTERRLFEKLRAANFDAAAAKRATERLKELGLINDESLAEQYAEECARRGMSKKEAFARLYTKGFSADTVKAALETADFDEENGIAVQIEKKYKAKLAAGETQKVYAALIRKGFSHSAVRAALKTTENDE